LELGWTHAGIIVVFPALGCRMEVSPGKFVSSTLTLLKLTDVIVVTVIVFSFFCDSA